jgi:hypothetical protein
MNRNKEGTTARRLRLSGNAERAKSLLKAAFRDPLSIALAAGDR